MTALAFTGECRDAMARAVSCALGLSIAAALGMSASCEF